MSQVMVTMFFDQEGIILLGFLEKGKTISSDYYCNLLHRIQEQLWHKRAGKMALHPILLEDNACPHVSHVYIHSYIAYNIIHHDTCDHHRLDNSC